MRPEQPDAVLPGQVAQERLRVTWLTNIATPYRVPLWRAVAARHDLHVVFFAEREPNRDWSPDLSGLSTTILGLAPRRVPGVATPVYAPSRRLVPLPVRLETDVIVFDGWESPAFAQVLVQAHRRRVPVVLSYRSTQGSHRYRRGPAAAYRRLFLTSVDAVVTAGPASTQAVTAAGVPVTSVVTGFNVVDVADFAASAERLREGRKVTPGHTMLYVGQLIKRKNVETALRAWARTAGSRDRFAVVGTGELRQHLETVASSLGVGQRVDFRGHLEGDELKHAYADANALVLPSTEEVWGLVVNEALASGLHVVVSRAAGVAESVAHMPGVFLATPDEDDLARAMTDSRTAWRGFVANPPMLQHTPGSAADAFTRGMLLARTRRDGAG